jgi:translation initiation factor 2 beta subunit (eIF-2beta)/eIF-5
MWAIQRVISAELLTKQPTIKKDYTNEMRTYISHFSTCPLPELSHI